jgi:hypothetical protein
VLRQLYCPFSNPFGGVSIVKDIIQWLICEDSDSVGFKILAKLSDACDRTTSEMRSLSLQDQLGDSQRSKNTQTHHIQAYNTIYEVQIELLHIRFNFKCYKS